MSERFILVVCCPDENLVVEVAVLDNIDQVNDLVRMAKENGGIVRVISAQTPVTDLTDKFV